LSLNWIPVGMDEPRRVVQRGYDDIGAGYHGCGPGDPATRLLSQQHTVLGVDLSLGQLRLARELAPRASLVMADITTFELAPASIDAVVSFFALGHLPPDTHASLVASIARWLRPGGFLLTSAPLIAGVGVEPDWLGVPMFFGGVGERAMTDAVRDAGLTLVGAERVGEDEEAGRVVEFLWVTATKPADHPPPPQMITVP
jgi:SAM-dependent methyltransferase